MPSSEFAPLAPPVRTERRFATLASQAPRLDGGAPAPEVDVAPDEAAAELRRAFEAGYAEGKASRDAEIAAVQASFRETLERLARFRGELRHRYERELLEVALGVARKVVRDEIAQHPEHWLEMLRAAVACAVEREHIVVRVPPALGAFLRDADPPLRTRFDDVKVLEIVDDPGLADGACLLETRFGDVDLGLDTQLDACARALVGAEGTS